MSRLMRSLASVRLAAWLIVALLGFLLVSFLVPQRGIYPAEQVDAFLVALPLPVAWLVAGLALDHAFTSIPFYVVASLLALNLIVCTARRLASPPYASRSVGAGRIPESAVAITVDDVAAVERILAPLRFLERVVDSEERRLVLRRGGLGFAGSMLLHLGLILVLVGGVVSGLTTFRGEILFAEGQTRADARQEYLAVDEVPRLGRAFGNFRLRLDRMEFVYEDGNVIDSVAHLTVIDSHGERETDTRVNYPLTVQGKSFLLQDAGHSVWLTVRDGGGRVLSDSFVNLATVTKQGYADSLDLGGTRLSILSRPNADVPIGAPVEEGLTLVKPIVGVSPAGKTGAGGMTWMSPGDPPRSFGGYSVSVNEVRIWNRFMVRADKGRYVVYLSFLLILLGSVLRFLDPDRRLNVALIGASGPVVVHLWGAERYRSGGLPREGLRLRRDLEAIGGRECGAGPDDIEGERATQ